MEGFGNSPFEMIARDAMMAKLIEIQGFVYSARFEVGTNTALGVAPGSATSSLTVNTDRDFVVQAMNFQAFTSADTPETNPDYFCNIIQQSSTMQLMAQPQSIMNIAGAYTGTSAVQRYRQLPTPWFWIGGTTIATTLTNRSAVAPNLVDISYSGFHIRYITDNPRARQGIFGQ